MPCGFTIIALMFSASARSKKPDGSEAPEGMVDGVVWLPTNSRLCSVRTGLGTDAGGRVHVTKGGAA